MGVDGSPEYALTWKHWDMPSGPPICALRASGRRTSGSGCIGWATPMSRDHFPAHRPEYIAEKKAQGHGMANLNDQVQVAGWPSPTTPSGGQTVPEGTTAAGRTPDGRKLQVTLENAAKIAGWPTPTSVNRERNEETLAKCAEFRKRNANQNTVPLYLGEVARNAAMAGWPTPTTRDHKDGDETSCQNVPVNALLGRSVHLGSTVEMTNAGALNPQFPCWLMGFPIAWESCADLVTRSSRKSPRSSSKPTGKP